MRGVLGQTVIQFRRRREDTGRCAGESGNVHQVVQGGSADHPAVAPHAMYTLDGPTLKAARELSRRTACPRSSTLRKHAMK